ncbi:Phosphomethylpyrimidine kinase [Rhodovastum atsumiense]|uniref:hydroxymethylpyrimidine kinase n=1 Tax=Rhodovastum atsumiense TaxID=504468 RepID=A0A5M6IKJ9_9PROT|nr:bifunctional hydroxymethylpyrimidine kinase/phosphomethylpyrimidine kinase [Rhodovastum atsumiense]KAA5608447.1 bifunctional hydroxymethylpyrimidine kinase/phosphomethylpyrimidine kinase [Rhodovastum atsumiense]CAH2604651.1 Phosphomethylpyrimidine kinase [Rhodovastum atsumiense]
MKGRVLVIAGSDSGGGAGIQADIKTITALGGFAMTAITALTAQDTRGVHDIHPVPPAFVQAQMRCVLGDLGADAIKTGMLGDAAVVDAICEVLAEQAGEPALVVDPVLVAKGGARLTADAALQRIRDFLLPRAALITPNLPEAEVLTGLSIADEADMQRAAAALLALGVPAVLLKGGHLDGDRPEVVDLLATRDGVTAFRSPRIATRHTHGTGCTLASAVAAGLAQGMQMVDAVRRARAYVQAAIAAAPGLGGGHGPLDHSVTMDPARLVRRA